MGKILTPLVECVSVKLVYRGAEHNSNKPAERLICQNCYAQVRQGGKVWNLVLILNGLRTRF